MFKLSNSLIAEKSAGKSVLKSLPNSDTFCGVRLVLRDELESEPITLAPVAGGMELDEIEPVPEGEETVAEATGEEVTELVAKVGMTTVVAGRDIFLVSLMDGGTKFAGSLLGRSAPRTFTSKETKSTVNVYKQDKNY